MRIRPQSRWPDYSARLIAAALLTIAIQEAAAAADPSPLDFMTDYRFSDDTAVETEALDPQQFQVSVEVVEKSRKSRRLSDISLDTKAPDGVMPERVSETQHQEADLRHRTWTMSEFHWTHPGLYHRPLYFQDLGLERYGHTVYPALQPVVSGAKFFGTIPLLPYKLATDPCRKPIYTLGYYRPGSVAPQLRYRLTPSAKGAVSEAATVAGAILLIP